MRGETAEVRHNGGLNLGVEVVPGCVAGDVNVLGNGVWVSAGNAHEDLVVVLIAAEKVCCVGWHAGGRDVIREVGTRNIAR